MNTNPYAAVNNLHHTRTQYDYTDEELYREQQRDRAEEEYFAQIGPATHDCVKNGHDYPRDYVSGILVPNGAIDFSRDTVPF